MDLTAIVAASVAMLAVLTTLLLVIFSLLARNRNLEARLEKAFEMTSDVLEGSAAKGGIPIRRDRELHTSYAVRPDGLLERSDGKILDARGNEIHEDDLYKPMWEGPQPLRREDG